MKTFNWKPLYGLVSAALLMTGLPALAQQDQDQDSDDLVLEEVIVTATKRVASASEIPMNISAIDGEALRAHSITDIKALLQDSVEISAPQNGARFADSVTVRGLNVSRFDANNLEQFVRSTLA